MDANIDIQDYISVRDRAVELGCAIPDSITILPVNFSSAASIPDMLQRSEAATVRTLFRTNAVPFDELVSKDARGAYIQNNAIEWIAPTLFISGSLWSQNPLAVGLALNVLATYITDFFKGVSAPKIVKLEIVVERKGAKTCKKLSYEGDIAGLRNLNGVIERLSDE